MADTPTDDWFDLAARKLKRLDAAELQETDHPDLMREFHSCVGMIRPAADLALLLLDSRENLDTLPPSINRRVAPLIQEVAEACELAASVKLDKTPGHVVAEFLSDVNEASERWRATLALILAALVDARTRAVRLEAQLGGMLDARVAAIDDVSKRATELLKEAMSALEAAQRTAELSGMGAYLASFSTAETQHSVRATRWLQAAAIPAVLLLTLLLLAVFDVLPRPRPYGNGVQVGALIGARVALASLLTYLLVTCVRAHRNERHNAIVNAHRLYALRTFEAFANAPRADDATRNAVLLQATHSIFSSRPTGFLAKDDLPLSAAGMLDIVKEFKKPA